jgi:hypothetical protein
MKQELIEVRKNLELFKLSTAEVDKIEADLAKFKELLEIQKSSTEPMDDYHRGMYNGIECVVCLLEEREPAYK